MKTRVGLKYFVNGCMKNTPRKNASPGKISPGKFDPGKFSPGRLHPGKIAPILHEFLCDFFLISSFYFYGNFHGQVKSIFIQFNFLIINNNLFIIFCCCCCCLFNLFLFIFNFQLWHIIYRI